MSNADFIKVVEVGPRDGLQNESQTLTAEQRAQLIHHLSDAGLSHIEVGSFVSPKWVPQMANTGQVYQQCQHLPAILSCLVPNVRGLQDATDNQVNHIALFAACTDSFSQKNINCSMQESLAQFSAVASKALAHRMTIRGYLSCVIGCPYEGHVPIKQVVTMSEHLLSMGCEEISLGDTIGVGTPKQVKALLNTLAQSISIEKLAIHCHDTYGQALANVYTAIECGVKTIDSSVAGLGGCPYAKGSSGNLATEDLIYLLHGLGLTTNVDLDKLISSANHYLTSLGCQNRSKVSLAYKGNEHEILQ